MTLTLWDVIALVLITLVITLVIDLTIAWGVIMYVRRLHKSIMTAIEALQQTDAGIARGQATQTDLLQQVGRVLTEQTALTAEAGQEQARQSTLLEQMLRQLTEQTKVLIIGNAPRVLQANAKLVETQRQEEIAQFFIRSGFFTTADSQARLTAYLSADTRIRIDAERGAGQSIATILTNIVQAAADYSQLPQLCATARNIFNGSLTGNDFIVRCGQWGIRLPAKESGPEQT